jgi:hypothetical protein
MPAEPDVDCLGNQFLRYGAVRWMTRTAILTRKGGTNRYRLEVGDHADKNPLSSKKAYKPEFRRSRLNGSIGTQATSFTHGIMYGEAWIGKQRKDSSGPPLPEKYLSVSARDTLTFQGVPKRPRERL